MKVARIGHRLPTSQKEGTVGRGIKNIGYIQNREERSELTYIIFWIPGTVTYDISFNSHGRAFVISIE